MLVCPLCRITLTPQEAVCPRDGQVGQEVAWTNVPAALEKRFTIVEPFASGGTGSLYIADEPETGRRAMLKVIPKAPKAHQAERQRTRRELVKQATLSSTHVAVPLATGEADEALWLFREWIDGISLRVRLHRSGALPEQEALAIGAQLAAALDDLHRAGLLHRALKPEHIMLVPSRKGAPRAVLIDAGIARPVEGLGAGLVVGTPGYVAPEQVQGKLVSFRSDLYALGCVMYEMLTGQPAFSASDVSGTLAAQLRGAMPPMPETLPQGIAPLLRSLLARDPQDRPFSAQKLRRTLDPFLPDGTPVIRQSNATSSPFTDDQKPTAASGGTVRPPPPPGRSLSRPPAPPTSKSVPPPASGQKHDRPEQSQVEAETKAMPKNEAKSRDATQPIDFSHVLSVTTAPRASTRPPVPSSPPPPPPEVAKKPEPRLSADHTQPIRLDQILAVAETRRKSSTELPPVPASAPPAKAPASTIEVAPEAYVAEAPIAKTPIMQSVAPKGAAPVQNSERSESKTAAAQGSERPGSGSKAPAVGRASDKPLPKLASSLPPPASVPAALVAAHAPRDRTAEKPDDRSLIDVVDEDDSQGAQASDVEDAKTKLAPVAATEAEPAATAQGNAADALQHDPAVTSGAPALHKPTDAEIEAAFAGETPPSGSVHLDDPKPALVDARSVVRTLVGIPTNSPSPLVTATAPRGSDAPPPAVAEGSVQAATTPLGLDSQQLTLPRDPDAAIAAAARMNADNSTSQTALVLPLEPRRKALYAGIGVVAVALLSFSLGQFVNDRDTAVAKQEAPRPAASAPEASPSPKPAATNVAPEKPTPAVMPLAEAPKPEPKVEAIAPSEPAPQLEDKKPEPAAVVQKEEPRPAEPSEHMSRSERRRAERAAREAQEKSEKAESETSSGGKTNEEAWAKARDEARAHYAAGRYKEAADAYAKAAKYNPGHAGTWSGLGGSRLKANDARGAVQAYQKAVKISPETSGFHAALGRAYLAADDKAKAKAAYRKALSLDPNNEAAKAALSEL